MSDVIVPLFPLPEFFLFPGAASPLHIFEPRYRAMVEDLLDSPGRLVMGCIDRRAAPNPSGDPAVHALGGFGEIVRHRQLPDGRYLIWLVGLGRVRIEEVDSRKPYRLTRVNLIDDRQSSKLESARLRPRLIEAIETHAGQELELAEDMSVGLLADLLAQCLSVSPTRLRDFFDELDATRRAEMVLSEHASRS